MKRKTFFIFSRRISPGNFYAFDLHVFMKNAWLQERRRAECSYRNITFDDKTIENFPKQFSAISQKVAQKVLKL